MSSHKHGLASLVDDVVVDPAVIWDIWSHCLFTLEASEMFVHKKESTAPVKDGEFTKASDSDPPYRSGDLTKTAKKTARRHFAPKDKMPQDKMSQGHFAPNRTKLPQLQNYGGHFAPFFYFL